MMTIERTVNELKKRIQANNFGRIVVTMKCNGDPVAIVPCSAYGIVTSFDQVDYYLVESPSLPWLGGSTLESVAKSLNNYARLLKEKEDDACQLKNMRNRMNELARTPDSQDAMEEWEAIYEAYSDYFKDVYGHRPRDIRRPAWTV